MKTYNFSETNFEQLSESELIHIDGGSDGVTLFSFILTGVLDGVKHNTECHLILFGKKIF